MLSALASAALSFASVPRGGMPDKSWLIAAAGHCDHQRYVTYNTSVQQKGLYVGEVAFDFFPSKAIQFTDAPYHEGYEIGIGGGAQTAALSDSAWDHKNIALVEHVQDEWAISVYEVEEHAACGADCVHYVGYVSAQTTNFPHEGRDGRFPCQLFVDSNSCVPVGLDVGLANEEAEKIEKYRVGQRCQTKVDLAAYE